MSKFQINDIKLDGSELFNDSENFLSDLKESEMDEIIGGLSKESFDKELIQQIELDERVSITTVYIPKEPICYPVRPIRPIRPICYPIKPICDIKPLPWPIKPIYYPCPVIL